MKKDKGIKGYALVLRPRVLKGVPWCSEEECPQYDGKRCELIGGRPSGICEPAVKDMAAEIRRLRKGEK